MKNRWSTFDRKCDEVTEWICEQQVALSQLEITLSQLEMTPPRCDHKQHLDRCLAHYQVVVNTRDTLLNDVIRNAKRLTGKATGSAEVPPCVASLVANYDSLESASKVRPS